jgi:hypothetical protein
MIRSRGFRPRVDWLDDRCLPSTVPGLTPTQIEQAYGFSTSGVAGAGQTIAIVDAFHDPNLAGDLAAFDRANNLPIQSAAQVAGMMIQVNLAGGQTDDGWAGEEALDVEWAHAMAPGAGIVVVEARSDSINDLMAAVNVARNLPGVSVVAMSWGGSEFAGETSYDSFFTTPAGHTPITFVAASGDSSAYAGAQWPASSPNVVAVGGTTLLAGASGTYLAESGWYGSGGGVSAFESEPSYQAGVQGTGRRTTPDVAIDANPSTGLTTYVTAPSTGQGTWEQVGGTSASAQVWAGLLADADQVRASFGKGTLSSTTTLAALYGTSSAFNDVTSGSNGYRAGLGYDLVTGLGSPRVASVISALVLPGTATPSRTSVTSSAVVSNATTSARASALVASPSASPATSSTTAGVATIIAPSNATSTSTGLAPASLAAGSQVALASSNGATTAQPSASNAVPQGPSSSSAFAVRPAPSDEPPALPEEQPSDEPAVNQPATGMPAATAPSSVAPTTPAEDPAPTPPQPPAPAPEGERPVGRPDQPDVVPNDVPNARPGGETSRPTSAPPRPASSSSGDDREDDQAEASASVSGVGVAVVALAGMVWRARLRHGASTPRGPRDLFRTPL